MSFGQDESKHGGCIHPRIPLSYACPPMVIVLPSLFLFTFGAFQPFTGLASQAISVRENSLAVLVHQDGIRPVGMVVRQAVTTVRHHQVELSAPLYVSLHVTGLRSGPADETAASRLFARVDLYRHVAAAPLVRGLLAHGGVAVEHHELYRGLAALVGAGIIQAHESRETYGVFGNIEQQDGIGMHRITVVILFGR